MYFPLVPQSQRHRRHWERAQVVSIGPPFRWPSRTRTQVTANGYRKKVPNINKTRFIERDNLVTCVVPLRFMLVLDENPTAPYGLPGEDRRARNIKWPTYPQVIVCVRRRLNTHNRFWTRAAKKKVDTFKLTLNQDECKQCCNRVLGLAQASIEIQLTFRAWIPRRVGFAEVDWKFRQCRVWFWNWVVINRWLKAELQIFGRDPEQKVLLKKLSLLLFKLHKKKVPVLYLPVRQ